MFFKAIVVFGVIYFNVGLGYAQYMRPGWFVTEEKTNSPMADIVHENQHGKSRVEKKSVKKQPSMRKLPQYEIEAKPSKSAQHILNSSFSLSKRELKLASILLKNEYKNNVGRNLVVSPLSFYAVSVLLANGVVDSSLHQFSKIFSIFRLADVNDKLKQYLLSKGKTYEWGISLWGNVFSQRYRTLIGDIVKAETWSVQDGTDTLNAWMSEKTQGIVNKIIEERPVNDDELFVLASLGFYHNWENPFYQSVTKKKIFYAVNGEQTSVNMMYQNGEIDYFENEFMQAVRLFFDTGDFIVFYLPRKNSDFSKFVANFEDYKMMPDFRKMNVDLFIPKFQLSYNLDDVRALFAAFEVTEIFSPIYNFAKMINFDTQAQVSDILMGVRLRIDEGGVPDAENDVIDEEKNEHSSVAVFNANRPFVFMINQGDIIGAIVKGNKLSVEEVKANQQIDVGEVQIKERKNGNPAWYENKNEQGDFYLKDELKNKTFSGTGAL